MGRPPVESFDFDGEISVAVFAPSRPVAGFAWCPSGALGLAVDGYMITAGSRANEDRRALLDLIEDRGVEEALRSVVTGSFNLVALDVRRRVFTIANDRLGSIPLYYALVAEGCVASTHPAILRLTGLVDGALDLTGLAELMYLGYTVGERHVLRDVHVLPAASLLSWDSHRRSCVISQTALNPFAVMPRPGPPDVDEIAATVSTACRRLARLGKRVAHLQSGGMDSRLILAAWPEESELPCYTYGQPQLADVPVARSVAGVRRAPMRRICPHGDSVAEHLDDMYLANGPHVWPDRYLTARAIRDDGFDAVLDGFLGGLLIGGGQRTEAYFSRLNGHARLLNASFDYRVSKIGLEHVTETLFNHIVDRRADGFLRDWLHDDVASELAQQKVNVVQDIFDDLKRLMPPNDSLVVLLRNFKLANGQIHNLVQQGVTCRRFVEAYYPLATDVALLESLLAVDSRQTAYRKVYVSLYKRHFPEYAELPLAASGIPVRRSPLWHQWASRLRSRGFRVPFSSNGVLGTVSTANDWDYWLKGSSLLRAKAIEGLTAGGLCDPKRVAARMRDIAEGRSEGCGDLFHLAGMMVFR
jgi:Glutamine amidotransferase domain